MRRALLALLVLTALPAEGAEPIRLQVIPYQVRNQEIPVLLADSFIEALRDRLAVAEMGATFISGLVGNVDIPKRTGSATAY